MMSALSTRVRRILKGALSLPSDARYRWDRARFAPSTGGLPAGDEEILGDLDREGIAVTSLERLAMTGTAELREGLEALLPTLLQHPDVNPVVRRDLEYAVFVNPAHIVRNHPEILLWGLQPRLLDLVEAYIGLPAHCLSVSLRRDLVEGLDVGTRRWHLDYNDRRYLKVIVYLNDVGEGGGPYQYIPKSAGRQLTSIGGRKSVSDHEMERLVPRSAWRSVHGPAGTVIFTETAFVYHRGANPLRERMALFYSFASRRPKRPDLCRAIQFSTALEHLTVPLTDRQRASLDFGAR